MYSLNIIDDYLQRKTNNLFLSSKLLFGYECLYSNPELNFLQITILDKINKYCKYDQKGLYSFPFLSNGLLPLIQNNFNFTSFKNALYIYSLFLYETNFLISTFQYYHEIILTNFFGIPQNLIENGVITEGTFQTDQFKTFVDVLAKWYTGIEKITFFLRIFEDFFKITTDSNLIPNTNEQQFFSNEDKFINGQKALKLVNYGAKYIKLNDGTSINNVNQVIMKYIVSTAMGGTIKSFGSFLACSIVNLFLNKIKEKLKYKEEGFGLVEITKNINMKLLELKEIDKFVYELIDMKVYFIMKKYLVQKGIVKNEENPLKKIGINVEVRKQDEIIKDLVLQIKKSQIMEISTWEGIDENAYSKMFTIILSKFGEL